MLLGIISMTASMLAGLFLFAAGQTFNEGNVPASKMGLVLCVLMVIISFVAMLNK